jgi:phosphomannomutase
LLEELGCRVTVLGEEQDGRFAHPAEPTEANLRDVAGRVAELGADVAFCQDPDADRLAIIDAAGRYIGEEYTVAICARHLLAQRPGPVVINCATSQMTCELARQLDVPCHRSAVGEANVVDAMLQHGAVFGGEGNGGPIDPRVGLVRDSFIGMATVLDAMTARNMSVAELADELPRYQIVKQKAQLPAERLPAALDAIEEQFADAEADRLDGLRLTWPDRWLLVRPSNTEPIVRLIAEAPETITAETLCRQAAAAIEA